MIKLLKNQSSPSSIIVLRKAGISIPAAGTYLINTEEYPLWTTTDIITEISTYINSGDIVVNDGVRDLTAAEGIRYIEKVETIDIQSNDTDVVKSPIQLNFEGDVTVVEEANGKATVTIGETQTPTGKLIDFFFVASGNTSNKWLGIGNGSTASDTLPYVVPWDSELKNLTFSNQDDNVDIDVEIYKNGVLVFTWEVRNKRTAWKSNNINISFSQGDRLSCFLKKYTQGTGDNTAQDPIIEVILSVDIANPGEGGTQNGV